MDSQVFAPIEAKYHAEVTQETFGHLEPKMGSSHEGTILFMSSEYDEVSIISSSFPTLGDTGSPQFFDDANDFILGNAQQGEPCEAVGVYRFTGAYHVYKNGKTRFTGTLKRIDDSLLA
ncbi:hypothetical protein RYA05_02470 [Pseudomonas syringae pv. actinidiae]|nr:hypothetical protein [Pseudomonas syringae pv. actinidiae]